jgi:PPOX class probable F420-dependent enzyme
MIRGGARVADMTSQNPNVLPDPSTPFGELVRRRLREERTIWLTTIGRSGTPQPNPVWFLWQEDPGAEHGDGSFLIYNKNDATRLRDLTARPRVSLNFDRLPEGRGVVVFTGSAELLKDHPPAHEVPEYAAKYEAAAARSTNGEKTLQEFLRDYSVVTRIRPDRVRGF